MVCGVERFSFCFWLDVLIEILSLTDILNNALQKQRDSLWEAIGLVKAIQKKIRELCTDAAFDCVKHSAIEFAAENGIDVPDFTAPYNHRDKGRHTTKLNSRLQGYAVDTFVESGVGDGIFDAHYKRLYFEVIDALVADFEGRFSETTCEIIEAMASLNPADSFAKYSKAIIDMLGRHFCDDFDETETRNVVN